ncbi:MAG: energy transducer TonB, partial [Burkholderiaceae bacterium]
MHSARHFVSPARQSRGTAVRPVSDQVLEQSRVELTAIEDKEAFRQKAARILLVAGLHLGLLAWIAHTDYVPDEVDSPVRLDVRTIAMPSADPATTSNIAEEAQRQAHIVEPAIPRIKEPLLHIQARRPSPLKQAVSDRLNTSAPDTAFSLPAQSMQNAQDGASTTEESAVTKGSASSATGTSGATSGATSAVRFDADYLKNPAPEYPSASRRMREEGTVHLDVNVTVDGKAGELRIRKSSGYARLDEAALDTV